MAFGALIVAAFLVSQQKALRSFGLFEYAIVVLFGLVAVLLFARIIEARSWAARAMALAKALTLPGMLFWLFAVAVLMDEMQKGTTGGFYYVFALANALAFFGALAALTQPLAGGPLLVASGVVEIVLGFFPGPLGQSVLGMVVLFALPGIVIGVLLIESARAMRVAPAELTFWEWFATLLRF